MSHYSGDAQHFMGKGMSIDVRIYMERGMYERLVDRAQDQGVPLSAVVRDAVAEYFEHLPEVPDREPDGPQPDDPIWQLPHLSEAYGALSVPGMFREGQS